MQTEAGEEKVKKFLRGYKTRKGIKAILKNPVSQP
jgi:hypothetical protein